jgi:hypothetical protein
MLSGMTPEERWKIQGRTRDELRTTKEKVITLKADIADHAERLKEAHHHLTKFLAVPTGGPGPTGMTPAQYVIHFFRDLLPGDIERKVQEFEEQSERLKKLEAQVAEFDH